VSVVAAEKEVSSRTLLAVCCAFGRESNQVVGIVFSCSCSCACYAFKTCAGPRAAMPHWSLSRKAAFLKLHLVFSSFAQFLTLWLKRFSAAQMFIVDKIEERTTFHEFQITGSTYAPVGDVMKDDKKVKCSDYDALTELAAICAQCNDSSLDYNEVRKIESDTANLNTTCISCICTLPLFTWAKLNGWQTQTACCFGKPRR